MNKASLFYMIFLNSEEKCIRSCKGCKKGYLLATILFDLLLYVQGKHLRSCWDGQFFNHTVPGQVSMRQFTSI